MASSRSASLPSVGVSSAERLLPCGPSRWARWSRRALFWLRRAHGPSQADLIPLPRIEAEVDRRKGGWRGSPGSGRSPGGSERSQLPSPLSLALQGPRAPSAAHVLPATPRQLSSEAVWLRRVHARVCVGKGAPWRLPWACRRWPGRCCRRGLSRRPVLLLCGPRRPPREPAAACEPSREADDETCRCSSGPSAGSRVMTTHLGPHTAVPPPSTERARRCI